jgi:3-oxoacyl-[acyl-carrier-protein] synthase III
LAGKLDDQPVCAVASTSFAISAISIHQPPWLLGNDWFRGTIARKFVRHTGTQVRPISLEDEVTMAVRATNTLRREVGCDLQKCAAVVFVSPSFVPISIARKYLGDERAGEESVQRAAQRFARRLGMSTCRVIGINWFCAGYAKAMSILVRRTLPALNLEQDQFALVVTVGRISRITDYECKQTAPLFGDIATATLVARADSLRYPAHFQLLLAHAEQQKVDGVFFQFHSRENVLAPTPDGGQTRIPRRLVFSLDGMGIADAAPRAMSNALATSLSAMGLCPDDVQHVVPHQAGTAIVRLTAMKMAEIGIRAEIANGLTSHVGNLSSSSIAFALKQLWASLQGTIACPTAAVGNPGEAKIAQGCLLLQSTPYHDKRTLAA